MEIKSASDFVRMTRGALADAGYVRHERDGRVWFEGGGRDEARPALVLIHGANDHAGTWFAVAAPLAQRWRVIVPDLAGHGESEPRTGPIAISRVIAGLEAVLQDERELTIVGLRTCVKTTKSISWIPNPPFFAAARTTAGHPSLLISGG